MATIEWAESDFFNYKECSCRTGETVTRCMDEPSFGKLVGLIIGLCCLCAGVYFCFCAHKRNGAGAQDLQSAPVAGAAAPCV